MRQPHSGKSTKRLKRTALAALAAALATAAAAYASPGTSSTPAGPNSEPPAGAQTPLGRYGLHLADLTPAATLPGGETLDVATNSQGKCLLGEREGRPLSETCASTSGIARGEGITVNDECAPSGKQRMTIAGLAPENTTSVRLRISDGTSRSATVQNGTFGFEGTNPTSNGPYPTGVEWVSPSTSTPVAEWPVDGNQYCEPAE